MTGNVLQERKDLSDLGHTQTQTQTRAVPRRHTLGTAPEQQIRGRDACAQPEAVAGAPHADLRGATHVGLDGQRAVRVRKHLDEEVRVRGCVG